MTTLSDASIGKSLAVELVNSGPFDARAGVLAAQFVDVLRYEVVNNKRQKTQKFLYDTQGEITAKIDGVVDSMQPVIDRSVGFLEVLLKAADAVATGAPAVATALRPLEGKARPILAREIVDYLVISLRRQDATAESDREAIDKTVKAVQGLMVWASPLTLAGVRLKIEHF